MCTGKITIKKANVLECTGKLRNMLWIFFHTWYSSSSYLSDACQFHNSCITFFNLYKDTSIHPKFFYHVMVVEFMVCFSGDIFCKCFFPVCQFFILCQTEASCSSLFQSCPVYSLLGIRNLVQYLSLRQITLHYSPITQHSKRGVIKTA